MIASFNRWLASGYTAQTKFCLAVMLVAAALMHFVFLPTVTSVKAHYPASDVSEAVPQRFPIAVPVRYGEAREIKITLEYQTWQHSFFRIMPLGCIEEIFINGQSVPFDKGKRCNPVRGVMFDFAPYLQSGTNHIDVTLNAGGVLGLDFGPELYATVPPTMAAVLASFFMLGVGGLFAARLHRGGVGVWICFFFIASVLWHGWLHHRMSYGQFANDWEGHVDYVRAIGARLAWPSPYEGWVFYHPPLFYTVMAAVQHAASALGTFNVMVTVRLAALLCYLFFLYYGVKCLHVMLKHKQMQAWASVLFLFWPVSILLGGRLDSHSLFYALYAASMYHLLLAVQQKNFRQLMLAWGIAGSAMAIRSNALVMLGIHGVVTLHLLWSEGKDWPPLFSWFRKKSAWAVLVVTLAATATNLGRTSYYQDVENRNEPILVGNLYGNNPATSIVRKEPGDYLLLDVRAYFESPFWDIGHDRGFWNAYLKSSIYGAFSARWPVFAAIMQTLLLVIWALAFYQLWYLRKNKDRMFVPYAALLLLPALAMMVHRYLHPFGASQDVRYVYPMIITLCALFAMVIERCWKVRRIGGLEGAAANIAVVTGRGLIAVFILCAIGQYLTQWYLTKHWLRTLPEDVEISSLPPPEPHAHRLKTQPLRG